VQVRGHDADCLQGYAKQDAGNRLVRVRQGGAAATPRSERRVVRLPIDGACDVCVQARAASPMLAEAWVCQALSTWRGGPLRRPSGSGAILACQLLAVQPDLVALEGDVLLVGHADLVRDPNRRGVIRVDQ
jgi:hypothetical protein